MSRGLDDTGALSWIVAASPAVRAPLAARVKRLLDVTLAALLLALALPVLGLAIVLIRLSGRGPALFVQPRIGYLTERFAMLKLRTMAVGAEEAEESLAARTPGSTFFKPPDDRRVTRLGRWLRRASLDELPQLINVLRGEMSLVGPRPLLVTEFRRFPRHQELRRFSMKPGLTGLWQVSGRSLLSQQERMRLDLAYVDGWSLWWDLEILARTVLAVLSGRGAN